MSGKLIMVASLVASSLSSDVDILLIITLPVLNRPLRYIRGIVVTRFHCSSNFQFLLLLSGQESATNVILHLSIQLNFLLQEMIYIPTLALTVAVLARLSLAAPIPGQIERRIDQIISDSTKLWQQACVGQLGLSIPCRY
jgi:hypothetical protein